MLPTTTSTTSFDLDYPVTTLLAFIPLLITVGIFYYGFFRLPQTRITVLFSIFQVSLFIWQLNDVVLRIMPDPVAIKPFFTTLSAFTNFLFPLGLHLALVYTGGSKKMKPSLLKFMLYAPAAFFAMVTSAGWVSFDLVASETWRWVAVPNNNTLTIINTFWMGASTLLTMAVLVGFAIQNRTNTELGKQSMIIMLGFLIPSLQGLFTELIFPYVFNVNPVPLTSTTLSAFSICLIIALTRFDLLSYTPKESWRHIVREMNEGILIVDLNETIRFANPRFCQMTGYKQKELMGKSASQLLLPEWEREKIASNMEKRKQGISNRYELVMITKEKTQIVCEVSGSPHYDKNGNLVGSVAIMTDITERKQHERQLYKKHRETLQYQSMLLSAQISPHFIFNSLNSVQYYVINQEVEPALNYISEFSQLIRSVLANSMNATISLEDEMKFLKLYLTLETRRFGDKFTYEINVDDEIDPKELAIAPMLLQPYLENSVVHGVGQLEANGKIEIRFEKNENEIVCYIEDNGVGREKARELKILKNGYSNGQSLAMGLTAERLNLLNDLGKNSYRVAVHDLVDAYGYAAGTSVEVRFPIIPFV